MFKVNKLFIKCFFAWLLRASNLSLGIIREYLSISQSECMVSQLQTITLKYVFLKKNLSENVQDIIIMLPILNRVFLFLIIEHRILIYNHPNIS